MFRRKKACGRAQRQVIGRCYQECCRFAPDTEMEGTSKEERRYEEGDRVGHRPKMGQSAIQEENWLTCFLCCRGTSYSIKERYTFICANKTQHVTLYQWYRTIHTNKKSYYFLSMQYRHIVLLRCYFTTQQNPQINILWNLGLLSK